VTNSQELLETLPVAIYTTDAAGRLTFFNQAAADLWGRRPQLGVDQWCGALRLYWADGRPLAHSDCPMAVALKQGKPVRGLEAIAERPDGSRVRFVPFPTLLHDESGQLTGAFNLLMDVTERYDAELASARLGAIVVSSDDAIVSKTLDGIVTSWNAGACNIFGYDEGEMIVLVPGSRQRLDREAAGLEVALDDAAVVASEDCAVARDVVGVGMGCQQVGHRQSVPRDGVEQGPERRARVDEDCDSARLVADHVGVREPLGMHAPLDDHRR